MDNVYRPTYRAIFSDDQGIYDYSDPITTDDFIKYIMVAFAYDLTVEFEIIG